ncbi:MAG: hypothetical protein ABIE36_01405 [Candidatus Diapherotrites archaeon]
MNIDKIILEHVIHGLNKLEEGEIKDITLRGNISEYDAGELKGYLRGYNVEINKSIGDNYYNLKVSKKESKQNA